MAVRQAQIAKGRKRNHGDEHLDSFSLFSTLNALLDGIIERFGTNSAFHLLTSEAFTFVGNTALHFFTSPRTFF
jgi:hypothetical protein